MIKKPILEPTRVELLIDIDCFYTTYAYLYSPTFVFDGEIHDFYEIVFVNSGEVVVSVFDKEYVLKKNQVIIHAPNEPHKIRANDRSCSVGIITFGMREANPMLDSITDIVLDINDLEKNYILNIINEGTLLMNGKNFMQKLPLDKNKSMPLGIGQYIKNATELLLISLIRKSHTECAEKTLETLSFNKNNIINSVIDYIKSNLDKKITLHSISAHIGYSVSYISAVFKKHLNTSLISYFLNARIAKAKELIQENKLTFKEIAERLGFDSIQYFSTQFKKLTHFTPSQYQANCIHFNTGKYKYGDLSEFIR